MAIVGHTAVAITLNSTTVPAVDQWFGYSLYEVASTDIVPVVFKDGTSTGTILWGINMSTDGGWDGQIWTRPIDVPSGVLHVDTTGNPIGSVFI